MKSFFSNDFEDPKYVAPTSDIGFHWVFGKEGNEELVVQLLNACIDDKEILIDTVNKLKKAGFEISMDEFGGSVGGGGRYDEMIGKFTGQDTPACGFSIGFERIVMLLLENGYEVPTVKEKKAYLLEKKMTKEGLLKVMSLAKADRQAGKQVLIVNMKKNKKFQKEQLTEDGYTEIVDCYADSVENL